MPKERSTGFKTNVKFLQKEHNQGMKALVLVLSLLAVLLVGCSGASQQSLVGKYKGEFKMPEAEKDNPMAKMAEGMMGLFSFDLELKAENKFTMTVMMMPIGGDWSLSGKTITLTPKTVMGLTPEEFEKQNAKKGGTSTTAKEGTLDKPIRLEVQEDGKSLKAIDNVGGDKAPGELIFVKQG